MRALQKALILQVGDVFMHRRQGVQAKPARNFFIGRGIAVSACEARKKVENFFLSPRDRHGGHGSE